MQRRTKIILLLAVGTFVVVVLTLVFSRSSEKPPRQATSEVAQAFVAEFATYANGKSDDFRQRTEKFIASDYKNNFYEKFSPPNFNDQLRSDYKQSFVALDGLDFVSVASDSIALAIQYRVKILDRSYQKEEFEEKQAIDLSLDKDPASKEWKVSNVVFSQ